MGWAGGMRESYGGAPYLGSPPVPHSLQKGQCQAAGSVRGSPRSIGIPVPQLEIPNRAGLEHGQLGQADKVGRKAHGARGPRIQGLAPIIGVVQANDRGPKAQDALAAPEEIHPTRVGAHYKVAQLMGRQTVHLQ